jgi:hypothetical protein
MFRYIESVEGRYKKMHCSKIYIQSIPAITFALLVRCKASCFLILAEKHIDYGGPVGTVKVVWRCIQEQDLFDIGEYFKVPTILVSFV